MIKLVGKISTQSVKDSLDVWFNISKDVESTKSRIGDIFSNSFIIFDETTPHGTTLQTELTNAGWIEDVNYGVGDYKEDGSDRPEFVSQTTRDAQKAEQDNINETQNRPNLIASLSELPYQDMQEQAYSILPYDQLTEYHSQMVTKQNVISELLREKGLEDTKENWDLEGAKTKADLELEIITEKAKVDIKEVV